MAHGFPKATLLVACVFPIQWADPQLADASSGLLKLPGLKGGPFPRCIISFERCPFSWANPPKKTRKET